jgi:hypothetical protein
LLSQAQHSFCDSKPRFAEEGLTIDASNPVTLSHAAAHRLAILTAPCAGDVVANVCQDGITGDNLAVQPVIEVQDRFGNRATSFQGTVSVSTLSSEAVLRSSDLLAISSASATVSQGLARFTNLNLVATPSFGVELAFSSSSLLSVNSAEIRVLAAAASQMVVVTQPVGARTGASLPVVPIVELRDRFGNRASSDDVTRVTVTSTLEGVTSGTLGGSTTVTATAGLATFTGITFTGAPRAQYKLRFDANDSNNVAMSFAESSAFSVTNALAEEITISQQPTEISTGTTYRIGDVLSETVLQLLDAFDNLAEDDSSTHVTMTIVGGTGPARFVNSVDATVDVVRVTASAGVVRFTGVRLVGKPSDDIQLRFEANGYQAAFSQSIRLTHAQASSMSVTRNPEADLSGVALTTQPVVALFDRYGNAATTDSSTVVTASLYQGANGLLTAGTAATAVNGIVTFSGLTATGNPGEVNKLRFTAGSFSVDDQVGFKVRKNAVTTLSYPTTSYVENGTVAAVFTTTSDRSADKSFRATPSDVCSVNSSSGVVTMLKVGECTVTVEVPRSDNYYSLADVSATLTINKAVQSPAISIRTTLTVDRLGTLTLASAGGQGTGSVVFSAREDCRVTGNTLIAGEAGADCFVRVEKFGDTNYEDSIASWQKVTIQKVEQDPLFIGNASGTSTSVRVGDVDLFTHGGSGAGAVTYELDPGSPCSLISGTVLRASANGSCEVYAVKAESATHFPATSPPVTFTFVKMQQTVNFTSTPVGTPTQGQTYVPAATASSGLAVTYSIVTGSGTTCSVDSSSPFTVSFDQSGLCEIRAAQAGDSRFNAGSATQSIRVGLRSQTITFGELSNLVFGAPPFALTASASSGLTVTYQVDRSVSPVACTLSNGGIVTITQAGICKIIATQPGNGAFGPATPVTQAFEVAPDKAGAPHLVSFSVADRTATARFVAPSYQGGSDITRYRMEVRNNVTNAVFVNFACSSDTSTACTVTGLPGTGSQTYRVRVAAVTAAGIGTFSDWSDSLTTSSASVAVQNLSAVSTTNSVDLTWQAPLAIPSDFVRYDIYVWPSNQSQPASATTSRASGSTSASISVAAPESRMRSFRSVSPPTVAPSNAYTMKIVTVTSSGTDSTIPERSANGIKLGFTSPGVPAQIEISDMTEKIVIGWSPPLIDGGKPVLGYQVFVNDEPQCSASGGSGPDVCGDEGPENV